MKFELEIKGCNAKQAKRVKAMVADFCDSFTDQIAVDSCTYKQILKAQRESHFARGNNRGKQST